jgi:hypothetical protein
MIRITVTTEQGNGLRRKVDVCDESRPVAVRRAERQIPSDERVLSTIVTSDGDVPASTAPSRWQ